MRLTNARLAHLERRLRDERERLLRPLNRGLAQIDAALERLYQSPEHFGICEDTAEAIPFAAGRHPLDAHLQRGKRSADEVMRDVTPAGDRRASGPIYTVEDIQPLDHSP